MTFLELVQRVWMECGASGSSPGPSTVVSQSGEYARLVTWTNAAYKDIQTRHADWDWMRASASFTTVASQATYALGSGAGTVGVAVADFGQWARNTARNYLTSTGTPSEIFMDFISYEAWRNTYQIGAIRTSTSRPLQFSIAPDKSLCLGPVPIAGYTITCDYFTAPVDLAADADVPALPVQFHEAIVYRAMMSYGAYESAPEVYDRGEKEFKNIMRRVESQRLPEVTSAGALA